jgi:hypothetical protein
VSAASAAFEDQLWLELKAAMLSHARRDCNCDACALMIQTPIDSFELITREADAAKVRAAWSTAGGLR